MSSHNGQRAPIARVEPMTVGVWLSIEESLRYSSLNRAALYKILDQLDARKFGKRTLVRRASLDRFLTRLPKIGPRGQRPLRGYTPLVRSAERSRAAR